MKYTIHRNNKIVVSVNATGDLTEKLFGEETLTMNFTLTKFVEFKIGDSVQVYGKTYYIATEPNVEKISTREYRYNLTFNGIKYRLTEVQYFFYDEKNQLTMPEFSIMGNAQKMVELLVANANRVQNGWSVGKVEDTEHKLVDFSNYNCLGALTRIADEFGLEFWVDADKSIHLTERKRASGYTFAYGQSKGLKSISRNPYTEASLITRLYAKGAERNIPKNYRNGQKALRMPVPYLEANTDKYGIVEHTQTFDEVYPKRVGVVTEVYPDNPLQFTDSTLDFDLNAYNEYGTTTLIAGVSAKVIFQTGDLAGYTLEVKQYGFNSATKTFTLLKNKDEKSFEIPSEAFRPKVGDQYILVDIMMPEKYVENAEAELQAKAQEYLDKNSRQRFVYSVVPDPLYFKEIRANIVLGQTIRFSDPDFNLNDDIRIISLTRDIRNPYKISFEIAEQATITQIVRNYIEKEKKETELRKEQKHNAEMARRSYLFAEEIKNNVFDNEGYFDVEKIKPLSIETQHISVGSRMQQFTLPNVILTLSEDNLRLKNTAGEMVHLTINPNAPRTWSIAQNETPNFSANFNYIYLKADKVGSNAVFVVSEQKIMLDNDPIFYYFLVGSVSSVIDGVRRIKTNYGFTQISPNEITTGRLSSANGQNWIDLLQDRIEINASVRFAPNSPALTQVQGLVDNISVGGRNLLLNSKLFVMAGNDRRNSNNTNAGRIIVNASNGEWNAYSWVQLSESHKIGDIITFSMDIKSSIDCGIDFNYFPYYLNNYFVKRESFLAGQWKRVFLTGTIQSIDGNRHLIGLRGSNMASAVVEFRNAKIEKGNKPTDWTPAPEDMEAEILLAKTESINASKAYADAQDLLRKTEANAYADGKVTEAEKRAIIDATNKAEAAKLYARAQDDLLKTQLQSYADGIIDAEEQERIRQAQINLQAAKAYADAQDNLAKIAIKAYADGIVTAEESRAIADATAKMEQAKAHALGLVNNLNIGGRNLLRNANFKNNAEHWYKGSPLAEFSITDRSAKIIHSLNSYNEINQLVPCEPNTEYCVSVMVKGNGIARIFMLERKGNGYTNIYKDHFHSFNLTNEYQRVSFTFRTQPDADKFYAIFRVIENHTAYFKDLKIEKGNKPTDWTPAPEDLEAEITNAQNTANMALGKFDQLGVLAWKDAVEKAQLGETIIQGGYIKTELLNASAIVSNGGGITNIALQNAINGLAIGGRNLFLSPKILSGYAVEANTSIPLVEGKEYVVSFDIKGQNNGRLFLNNAIIFSDIPINPNPNEWFRISKVFTFRKNDYFGKEIFPHIYGATDVRNVKLEKGNKPTDWTPAPEDLEAQFQNLQNRINGVQTNVNTLQNGISNIQASLGDIKTKTDNFTSIQGGLVSSNIISVGDTQVNQNAFISGITDAGGLSVRFGAGANYANKNNAPFRVLDNGKMIAENAEISGNIDARSGKIGNFEISEGWLSTGNKDTWARGNSANFTDQSLFIREVGNSTKDIREVRIGRTAPLSTGERGTTMSIKNNMNETPEFAPNSLVENISLQLEAKNGKDNIALDILNGDIRVGGEKGVTNVVRIISNITKTSFSNQYIVSYTDMKIKNGIIVSVSNATGSF